MGQRIAMTRFLQTAFSRALGFNFGAGFSDSSFINMELSAEEFSRLVSHLDGGAATAGEEDHRRATRVSRQVQITIVEIAKGVPQAPTTVRVKNLSSRGLGFVRDRAMATGSQFLVHITRELLTPIELLCTVVHCRQLSNEIYSVGAEFTCVTPGARQSNPDEMERIRKAILA